MIPGKRPGGRRKSAAVVSVSEPDPLAEVLASYGLARCNHCQRIVLTRRIYKGRCWPIAGCEAARMIARAMEEGELEFALAIERGQQQAAECLKK